MAIVNSISFKGTEGQAPVSNVTAPKNDVQTVSDENKPSQKTKILVGAGLAAATIAGIILVARGKTVNKEAKEVIEKVKQEFPNLKDVEPEVKRLKNGGRYIKFNAVAGDVTSTQSLIMDKEGKIKGMILSSKHKDGTSMVCRYKDLDSLSATYNSWTYEGKKYCGTIGDQPRLYTIAKNEEGKYITQDIDAETYTDVMGKVAAKFIQQ